MILVDQFEELFRYSKEELDQVGINESVLFINMLLEAIKQDDAPIYLALTMRSEFIGDCSKYPGLTEMINMSNYLVPLMTREQKRMAIEGPVAVGGGTISQALVRRLLNDLSDHQDQLPILQHVLMRSWNYWIENREEDEPLDVLHYNAVGRIQEALSLHANEAFDELNDRQMQICEVLFKSITEKGNDEVGIRRPANLGEIAEIAGADEEEVIEVVDNFRRQGRSLLMPTENVVLQSDSVVEMSHESLIRIWTRLKSWVEEENESAQMYRRISEAAAMYQVGRTGLWRPPDLQLALNWQKKQEPTLVWAQRYDEAFERAIVFLDTSRITYEAEQRNQELLQQQLHKKTRIFALIMSFAALVAVVLFIFGVIQRIEAQGEAVNAIAQAKVARIANAGGSIQVTRAKVEQEVARAQADWAKIQTGEAKKSQSEALSANRNLQVALIDAEEATASANIARDSTTVALAVAEEARDAETVAKENANNLLYLSASQAMSLKSQNVLDNNLQGNLALTAFLYNSKYNGRSYDASIYSGLYEAISSFAGDGYNEFGEEQSDDQQNAVGMRSIVFSPGINTFFSTGSDGSVMMWDPGSPENNQIIVDPQSHPGRVARISPNGEWLAVGSDDSVIQVVNLSNGTNLEVTGHKAFIYDIAFAPDNSGFYSLSGDRSVRFYDFNKSVLIKQLEAPLKSMALSPDGDYIVGGSTSGKLIRLDISTGLETLLYEDKLNMIHAVDIHPAGKMIAFADNKRRTQVFLMSAKIVVATLIGHTSQINAVAFSDDGKLIATGSNDGTIHLHSTAELNELPIIMNNNHGFVWDIDFSSDGKYIVAATQNNILKLWPTDGIEFAKQLNGLLPGDISQGDWERYVSSVEYEKVSELYPEVVNEE